MKFSCERCGKKYATADTPQLGRVYKLKCKACGHLIVVKAATSGATLAGGTAAASARPSAAPFRAPEAEPAPPVAAPEASEIELEIGASEPAHRSPAGGSNGVPPGSAETPLPPAFEPTTEVRAAAVPAAAPDARASDELLPPAGDTGYVDLFADAPGPTAAPVAGEPPPPADPFLAAARASLPEGFAGDAGDPFAPIRAELEAAAGAGEGRPGADASPPITAPKVPEIPKVPAQRQGFPIALVAGGVVVMLGILVFVLVRFGKGEPPAAPPPRAAIVERAPPPPSSPAPAPAPVQVAPPAEPPAAAAEQRPAPPREEPRPVERRKRPERRAEAKAEPAPPPPPPREERQVAMPEASQGLTDEQVQKVLASTRKAFDGCIATAAKSSDVKLDGRAVSLRLNIQPNGTVTYPTLDDVTLNGTELGSCLKSASRLMVFPKFKGDPMRIEVPLTLSPR